MCSNYDFTDVDITDINNVYKSEKSCIISSEIDDDPNVVNENLTKLVQNYEQKQYTNEENVFNTKLESVSSTYDENIKREYKCITPLFYCKKCSKVYKSKTQLEGHIISDHSDILYSCDQCGKSYSHKESLQVHKRSAHEGSQYQS